MTSIGLTWQLYTEIQRCLKWTLMVQMLKEFSISYLFEPIAVVTFCTLWWPQLHSTYDWPQVSSIYFTRFLSVHSKACKKCFTILHKKVWKSILILFSSCSRCCKTVFWRNYRKSRVPLSWYSKNSPFLKNI